MKQNLKYSRYLLILLWVFVSMTTKADVWKSPNVKTYYSENKEYKLVITPKIISDKYHMWNYYKNNRHPQKKRILRKKKKFMQEISEQDTILVPCTARLYKINRTDSVLIWEKPLLNDNCPVYAIVANDGSSIATFDNWYSIGYGVNVFVVYNEKGEAKRTYKLEEISPFPLNDYSMSITSLYWRKEVKYTDNKKIEIVFETDNKEQKKRIYSLDQLDFEE